MRKRICGVLLIVAMFLAACGMAGDEEQVSDTLKTYLSAVANGDGEKACDQLTGEEAGYIFAEAAYYLPELRAKSCADALSGLSASLGGERSKIEEAEVVYVNVHGDRATARVASPHHGPTGNVAEFTRVDGRWLISGGIGIIP